MGSCPARYQQGCSHDFGAVVNTGRFTFPFLSVLHVPQSLHTDPSGHFHISSSNLYYVTTFRVLAYKMRQAALKSWTT